MPVGRDLPLIARRVGAIEVLCKGDGGKATLDIGDRRLERGVVRGRGAALDEHLLDLVLREGVVDGALGGSGLADTALSGVLSLRADGAADRECEKHERQPAPDRLLAMLRAPAPHPRRQVHGPSRRARPAGRTPAARLVVLDDPSVHRAPIEVAFLAAGCGAPAFEPWSQIRRMLTEAPRRRSRQSGPDTTSRLCHPSRGESTGAVCVMTPAPRARHSAAGSTGDRARYCAGDVEEAPHRYGLRP